MRILGTLARVIALLAFFATVLGIMAIIVLYMFVWVIVLWTKFWPAT